jgi:hypothetical protein
LLPTQPRHQSRRSRATPTARHVVLQGIALLGYPNAAAPIGPNILKP